MWSSTPRQRHATIHRRETDTDPAPCLGLVLPVEDQLPWHSQPVDTVRPGFGPKERSPVHCR
jgi:hypothetical protein